MKSGTQSEQLLSMIKWIRQIRYTAN